MLKKVVYLKQQNTRHKQPCLPCQRNTQTWFQKEPFFNNIGAKMGTPKNCSQKEQQTTEMKTCQRKKNRKLQKIVTSAWKRSIELPSKSAKLTKNGFRNS